jgi:hypothetical protein
MRRGKRRLFFFSLLIGVVPISFDASPAAAAPVDQKDRCKGGGYAAFGFKNQGQCAAFVNAGGALPRTTSVTFTSVPDPTRRDFTVVTVRGTGFTPNSPIEYFVRSQGSGGGVSGMLTDASGAFTSTGGFNCAFFIGPATTTATDLATGVTVASGPDPVTCSPP